jgi:S-DNA-T family DNA segregation ATPase FtsK/SpoIIIE
MSILAEDMVEEEVGEMEVDPMYDKAVEIVIRTRNASISFLQRKLRIGYNRSARIVEMMEKEGVIGEQIGNKPRDILVPPPEE